MVTLTYGVARCDVDRWRTRHELEMVWKMYLAASFFFLIISISLILSGSAFFQRANRSKCHRDKVWSYAGLFAEEEPKEFLFAQLRTIVFGYISLLSLFLWYLVEHDNGVYKFADESCIED